MKKNNIHTGRDKTHTMSLNNKNITNSLLVGGSSALLEYILPTGQLPWVAAGVLVSFAIVSPKHFNTFAMYTATAVALTSKIAEIKKWSKRQSTIAVGLVTALTAYYIIEEEQGNPNDEKNAGEAVGCTDGYIWCNGSCCPKDSCNPEFGCLAPQKKSVFEYLPLPRGGWNKEDLLDAKRPRGWMMDKFGKAHDYYVL